MINAVPSPSQGFSRLGRLLASVSLLLVAGCSEPVQTAEFIFAPDGLWWISARYEADGAEHARASGTTPRLFPTWPASGDARSTVFFRKGEGASKAIRPNTKLVWDESSTFDGLGFYAVEERNLLSLHRFWRDPVEGVADPYFVIDWIDDFSAGLFSAGMRPLALDCLDLAALMRGEELTNDDSFRNLRQWLVALDDSTQSAMDLLIRRSAIPAEVREEGGRYYDDITEFLGLFAAAGRLPSEWLDSLDSESRTQALEIQSKLLSAVALPEDSIGTAGSASRPDPLVGMEKRLERLRQFRALHGPLASLAAVAISDDDGERELIAEWLEARVLDPLLRAMVYDVKSSRDGLVVNAGARPPLFYNWIAEGLISPSIFEVPLDLRSIFVIGQLLLALQAELEIAPASLAGLSGVVASAHDATSASDYTDAAAQLLTEVRRLGDRGSAAFQLGVWSILAPAHGLVRVADAQLLNGGLRLEDWYRNLEKRMLRWLDRWAEGWSENWGLELGAVGAPLVGVSGAVNDRGQSRWGPRRPFLRFLEKADLVETNMAWHRAERAIYLVGSERLSQSWWVNWVTLRPQGEALLAELTAPEHLAAFLAREREDPSLESLRRRLLEVLGNRLLHTPWAEGGPADQARLEVMRQLAPLQRDDEAADRVSTNEVTVLDQTREAIVGSALRSPTVGGWVSRGKIESSRLLESLIESQVLATPLNREEVVELLVEVTGSGS